MTTRKGGQSACYALYARQAVIVVLKAHGALQIGIATSPAQPCRRESQRARPVAPHTVAHRHACHPQLDVSSTADSTELELRLLDQGTATRRAPHSDRHPRRRRIAHV